MYLAINNNIILNGEVIQYGEKEHHPELPHLLKTTKQI